MSEEKPKPRPRKVDARPSALIVECPECKNAFPVLPRKVQKYKRDEMTGQLLLDTNGDPIPIVHQSYEYEEELVVHPEYDPQFKDEYRALMQRHKDEAKHREKKPKSETIAGIAA